MATPTDAIQFDEFKGGWDPAQANRVLDSLARRLQERQGVTAKAAPAEAAKAETGDCCTQLWAFGAWGGRAGT